MYVHNMYMYVCVHYNHKHKKHFQLVADQFMRLTKEGGKFSLSLCVCVCVK